MEARFATFITPARVVPELMWSHTLCDGKSVTFAKAEKAIAQLNKDCAGGYSDWRLPSVEELFLQADRVRYNPAVDPEQFPDTKSSFYWSSTPDASYPVDCAWGVYFGGGDAYLYDRGCNGFVRAVRSVAGAASPGQ